MNDDDNYRTPSFNKLYFGLPGHVRKQAVDAYNLFKLNPRHPSLRSHPLKKTRLGKHENGSISITITMQYRAIFVTKNGVNLWYWIGTTDSYSAFTGIKDS